MLDIENRDGVAILHLRRLGANRLTVELLQRITAALRFVQRSDGVVLTGYRSTFAIDALVRPSDDLLVARHAAVQAIRTHPRPVVAAVNGDALGAGYDVAAAADLRLMTRGLIGTTRATALTVAEAAAIGMVHRPSTPGALLDEAIERARPSNALQMG